MKPFILWSPGISLRLHIEKRNKLISASTNQCVGGSPSFGFTSVHTFISYLHLPSLLGWGQEAKRGKAVTSPNLPVFIYLYLIVSLRI